LPDKTKKERNALFYFATLPTERYRPAVTGVSEKKMALLMIGRTNSFKNFVYWDGRFFVFPVFKTSFPVHYIPICTYFTSVEPEKASSRIFISTFFTYTLSAFLSHTAPSLFNWFIVYHLMSEKSIFFPLYAFPADFLAKTKPPKRGHCRSNFVQRLFNINFWCGVRCVPASIYGRDGFLQFCRKERPRNRLHGCCFRRVSRFRLPAVFCEPCVLFKFSTNNIQHDFHFDVIPVWP
jgi:hypothetical protein